MRSYLIRRLITLLLALFGIAALMFYILRLPGDPFSERALATNVSLKEIEKMRQEFGFDKPWYIGFWKWLIQVMKGNWGLSMTSGLPVLDEVVRRIPITLKINILSLFFTLIFAIPIGIYAALRQYSTVDYVITTFSFFGISMPTFWLGLMLMLIFGVFPFIYLGVKWLPIGGIMTPGMEEAPFFARVLDQAKYLILPVATLTIHGVASYARYMRSSLLEVIRQDYIRTARAKGLPENKVIFKHALRNALIPMVTIFTFLLPGLIGGATITEIIFSISGTGRMLYDAVMQSNIFLAQGALFISAILVVISLLLADIMYALVDPRITFS